MEDLLDRRLSSNYLATRCYSSSFATSFCIAWIAQRSALEPLNRLVRSVPLSEVRTCWRHGERIKPIKATSGLSFSSSTTSHRRSQVAWINTELAQHQMVLLTDCWVGSGACSEPNISPASLFTRTHRRVSCASPSAGFAMYSMSSSSLAESVCRACDAPLRTYLCPAGNSECDRRRRRPRGLPREVCVFSIGILADMDDYELAEVALGVGLLVWFRCLFGVAPMTEP